MWPFNSLQCCHVIIGENCYHFTRFIDAIDVLFRLFISLKVEYSIIISAHLWAFFQRHVYKLDTERRTVARRVINEFICELENISQVV